MTGYELDIWLTLLIGAGLDWMSSRCSLEVNEGAPALVTLQLPLLILEKAHQKNLLKFSLDESCRTKIFHVKFWIKNAYC